jgi:hypothetical protein
VQRQVRALATAGALLLFLLAPDVFASSSSDLNAAFTQMLQPQLDTSAVAVSNFTIEQKDMTLNLDSGVVRFLAPIRIDSEEHHYGGYFEGKAHFQFDPRVPMERAQLDRFFDSPSLSGKVTRVMLLFDGGSGREVH